MGRGETLFHEYVVGGLKFFNVFELRLDAQLVQTFLEKRNPAADAVDTQPAEGVEDDPIAGRCQVILLVEIGGLLDVGKNLFPRGARNSWMAARTSLTLAQSHSR